MGAKKHPGLFSDFPDDDAPDNDGDHKDEDDKYRLRHDSGSAPRPYTDERGDNDEGGYDEEWEETVHVD